MREALVAAIAVSLMGCQGPIAPAPIPRAGPWRIELDLHGDVLPFTFDLVRKQDSSLAILVHNAAESIVATDVLLSNDSVFIRMPLFDSEFKGLLRSDTVIVGQWYNYSKGPDYRIPFIAYAGDRPRFPSARPPRSSVSGSWKAVFSSGTTDSYDALGVFQQDSSGLLSGTFLTETGDYRYLEGVVSGDSLLLSSFDGSHAFLFQAALREDSLVGRFVSGTHWSEPWVASRDSAFRLRDPDSLTTLREGYEMVEFRFPCTDGSLVSSSDEALRKGPLMVQIMGSWCPNCVDEARLLREIYAQYHERGLNVVAIGFEKHNDEARALASLRRFKQTLDLPFPVLYGGAASKEEAGAKLPFLNHLMSYPTCIFIDRTGVVRRIRTGFYGPGTGEHYEHYKRNLNSFIEELLSE